VELQETLTEFDHLVFATEITESTEDRLSNIIVFSCIAACFFNQQIAVYNSPL